MNRERSRRILKIVLEDLGIRDPKNSGEWDLEINCPFHDDRRPSFYISFHPERFGVWYCHSCSLGGSLHELKEALGIDVDFALPKVSIASIIREKIEGKKEQIKQEELPTKNGNQSLVRSYLGKKRRYSEEEIEIIMQEFEPYRGNGKWGKYMIFPVTDLIGNTVGFTSRLIIADPRKPKTRHTSGARKSMWLFGAEQSLRNFGSNFVILTEGPFDALRLFSYGLPAVAMLGTPTNSQLGMISSVFAHTYTAFDGDQQGEKYKEKVLESIGATTLRLPNGKDPDNLTREKWNQIWEARKNKSLRWRLTKISKERIPKE